MSSTFQNTQQVYDHSNQGLVQTQLQNQQTQSFISNIVEQQGMQQNILEHYKCEHGNLVSENQNKQIPSIDMEITVTNSNKLCGYKLIMRNNGEQNSQKDNLNQFLNQFQPLYKKSQFIISDVNTVFNEQKCSQQNDSCQEEVKQSNENNSNYNDKSISSNSDDNFQNHGILIENKQQEQLLKLILSRRSQLRKQQRKSQQQNSNQKQPQKCKYATKQIDEKNINPDNTPQQSTKNVPKTYICAILNYMESDSIKKIIREKLTEQNLQYGQFRAFCKKMRDSQTIWGLRYCCNDNLHDKNEKKLAFTKIIRSCFYKFLVQESNAYFYNHRKIRFKEKMKSFTRNMMCLVTNPEHFYEIRNPVGLK